MLESTIQNRCLTWFRKKYPRAVCWKINDRFTSGIPDSIMVFDGRVVMVEFKAPRKKPTALQKKTHEKLADNGCEIYVVDNVDAFKKHILEPVYKVKEYNPAGDAHTPTPPTSKRAGADHATPADFNKVRPAADYKKQLGLSYEHKNRTRIGRSGDRGSKQEG